MTLRRNGGARLITVLLTPDRAVTPSRTCATRHERWHPPCTGYNLRPRRKISRHAARPRGSTAGHEPRRAPSGARKAAYPRSAARTCASTASSSRSTCQAFTRTTRMPLAPLAGAAVLERTAQKYATPACYEDTGTVKLLEGRDSVDGECEFRFWTSFKRDDSLRFSFSSSSCHRRAGFEHTKGNTRIWHEEDDHREELEDRADDAFKGAVEQFAGTSRGVSRMVPMLLFGHDSFRLRAAETHVLETRRQVTSARGRPAAPRCARDGTCRCHGACTGGLEAGALAGTAPRSTKQLAEIVMDFVECRPLARHRCSSTPRRTKSRSTR